MIAAVCAWHEHHALATEELEWRFSQDETLIVAAPALVEAYAVLTRLPPPHRLSPEDALALLEADFINPAKIIPLDRKAYIALLRRASHAGVATTLENNPRETRMPMHILGTGGAENSTVRYSDVL